MLVLSRKVGEKIVIGRWNEITLTVVSVRGGRVKLGIEADGSIPIQRAELEHVRLAQESTLSREVHHAMGIAH